MTNFKGYEKLCRLRPSKKRLYQADLKVSEGPFKTYNEKILQYNNTLKCYLFKPQNSNNDQKIGGREPTQVMIF